MFTIRTQVEVLLPAILFTVASIFHTLQPQFTPGVLHSILHTRNCCRITAEYTAAYTGQDKQLWTLYDA